MITEKCLHNQRFSRRKHISKVRSLNLISSLHHPKVITTQYYVNFTAFKPLSMDTVYLFKFLVRLITSILS